MRLSADPQAMIAFLQALGLTPVVDHQAGWGVFAGRGGLVAVHPAATAKSGAPAGRTQLNLAVADVDDAVRAFTALGLQARAWDEAYGRQGVVTDPTGHAIGINQTPQAHSYGVDRVHDQLTSASIDVVAIYPSTDFDRDAAFFDHVELVGGAVDDPWWCGLRNADHRGVVGLHRPVDEEIPASPTREDPPAAVVRLGFETSEPLDALAARLRTAGYVSATVLEDASAPRVEVVDPDAQTVQIHLTA